MGQVAQLNDIYDDDDYDDDDACDKEHFCGRTIKLTNFFRYDCSNSQ
jgi:hypothetical protein